MQVTALPAELGQLAPGDLVTVRGERATFAFVRATHSPRLVKRRDGTPCSGWSVDVVHTGASERGFRSFYAEDVRPKRAPRPAPARPDLHPNTCAHCGEHFAHTGKRGRQPRRCPTCR